MIRALSLVAALVGAGTVWAAEPPPKSAAGATGTTAVVKETPADVGRAAEAASRFQQRALEFARREARRATPFAQQAADRAQSAAKAALPAEQAHATAVTAKAAAEKTLKSLNESLQTAEQNQQAAEKALPQADATVKNAEASLSHTRELLRDAGRQLEAALLAQAATIADANQSKSATKAFAPVQAATAERIALLEKAIADLGIALQTSEQAVEAARHSVGALKIALADTSRDHQQLSALKPTAEATATETQKRASETERALKPLAEAKSAAEKSAAQAKAQADEAAARIALFEKSPPQADPNSIRLTKSFEHTRPIMACRFDPTGEYVLAGSQDDALHRWDFISSSRIDMGGQKSWICGFDVHPDGDLLVCGSYAGRLAWCNPLEPSPQPKRIIDGHKGYVRAVSISPNRQYVATCGNDNLVKIWSAADGALIAELKGHASQVYNVGFHPGGERIISGDLMGVLKEWEVGTWKHVRDLDAGVLHKYDEGFQAHCGGIRGMDFSADGKYLVVCGISEVTNAFAGVGTPTAVLFDCQTGARVAVMKPAQKFDGTCWCVRFDPAGRFIVGGGGGGSGILFFWKPGEEKAFFQFQVRPVVYDISFHPDGLRFAAGLFNNSVGIYDLGPKTGAVASAAGPPAKK